MNDKALAQAIIENVGGEQNVQSVVHCATRLRFSLKDDRRANPDAINAMDGVITVISSGGQFQVVIGNRVPLVYRAIGEFTALTGDTAPAGGDGKKKTVLEGIVDIVTAIFTPLLG
ncbi:PTS transporter subunit EIIB [Brenneria izadpanahii]|uniref:PTS transporter subunit EIIB n=1 Tax=Brenneria izadpanahii TaxID=2722756 RepID=UPI001FE33B22|nr:PTS transporter subunit EIIB [Brenneria izadpanahii]